MDFLSKLFGKKQSAASSSNESSQPPQAISPVAAKLHEVITAMCVSPGRSFGKGSHAAPLYELIPSSKIPKNVADLFVDVTTITAAMTGVRTTESMNALKTLCTIKGTVVNNIASMHDAEHTTAVMDFTGRGGSGDQITKVSFEAQRNMARAELTRRGSPNYDARYYADK
jgi:hypothetical protein